jgi:ankyrin repeat protein
MAAQAGAHDVVLALLARGAQLALQNQRGDTPGSLVQDALVRLEIAPNGTQVSRFLKTRSVLDTAILESFRRVAIQGDMTALEPLLACYGPLARASILGRSPMHWAAAYGQHDVLARLAQAALPMSTPDQTARQFTPLHWAIEGGHGRAVQALLDGGADPRIAAGDGTMPLAWAQEKGDAGVVALIEGALAAAPTP